MKYADEEAEAYYKMQEEEAKNQQEKRAQRQNRPQKNEMRRNDNNRRQGYEQVETLDQVKKSTGISFGGERPQFTRTKPKTETFN